MRYDLREHPLPPQARLRAQTIADLGRGAAPLLSASRRVVTIADRLINSVLAEHLKLSGYEATLSVFLPESGYAFLCCQPRCLPPSCFPG